MDRAATDRGAAVSDVLVVDPDPSAVSFARAYVRRRCADLGIDPDTCDTAVLLASETVTNALTHGRSQARLRVSAPDGALLVEVTDDNSRHPQPVRQDLDALDGRGMVIVDRLAARWGVRDEAIGKTIWFELAGRPAFAAS